MLALVAKDELRAEMDRMVRRLRAELDETRLDIGAMQAHAAGLVEAIRNLESLLGLPADKPRGAQAVARVALDAISEGNRRDRDGALTVAQIVRELELRGWLPRSKDPESAVRAAIRRLRQSDGRWGLREGRLYYHDREGVPESEGGVAED